MTQTTEGTGPGSVDRVKSKILNGDVKNSNLSLVTIIENGGGDFENVELLKAPDGTASSMDGKNLLIKAGEGYLGADDEDDADGGRVTISGGMQHGDGNSGSVFINGGDSSTDFENSDAGSVTLRGGDGLGPADSDGGSVTIRGGDCVADGTSGEAGSVSIRGGNSDGSEGGDVSISGGDSGTFEVEGSYEDNNGGNVNISGGNGGGTSAVGGNVSINGGYGTAGPGRIVLNSMVVLPVFATVADRNTAASPSPTNGMMCYVSELNAFNFYVNGSWIEYVIVT